MAFSETNYKQITDISSLSDTESSMIDISHRLVCQQDILYFESTLYSLLNIC